LFGIGASEDGIEDRLFWQPWRIGLVASFRNELQFLETDWTSKPHKLDNWAAKIVEANARQGDMP
jgi:hypothetical protein